MSLVIPAQAGIQNLKSNKHVLYFHNVSDDIVLVQYFINDTTIQKDMYFRKADFSATSAEADFGRNDNIVAEFIKCRNSLRLPPIIE
jgi:hypothetical protein